MGIPITTTPALTTTPCPECPPIEVTTNENIQAIEGQYFEYQLEANCDDVIWSYPGTPPNDPQYFGLSTDENGLISGYPHAFMGITTISSNPLATSICDERNYDMGQLNIIIVT